MGPQFTPVDFLVDTGQIQKEVFDSKTAKVFSKTNLEIGRVAVTPVPQDIACATAQHHGQRPKGVQSGFMCF